MRILLIRISSLGDVLLSTPVVRALRQRHPDTEIHVVVAGEFADIWQYNPHVNRVIAVDRSLPPRAMVQRVDSVLEPVYDIVLDLHRTARSRSIRHGRSKRLLRYPKHRLEKLALVLLKHRPRHVVHIVDRYFAPLKALGIQSDGQGLELWLPEEHSSRIYPPANRTMPQRPCIGIAPGARHATKQWDINRFTNVARMLQHRGWEVVLLGSYEERPICESILHELDQTVVHNCSGASLYDSARAIDRCSLVLSNDSGITHLAAARQVPVVVIYGSTVPALGFTPYYVPYRIVEVDGLSCRPCTHIGRARCPRVHFACMKNITIESVLKAIEELRDELDVYRSR